MIKREARLQTMFNKYVEETGILGYFELKQTKANSLAYNSLAEHQEDGLIAAKISGFRWKLSDADPRQKPFDYVSAPPMDSFVVIGWTDCFTIIHMSSFERERNKKERKSIAKDRAKEIAMKIVYF